MVLDATPPAGPLSSHVLGPGRGGGVALPLD